MGTGLLSMLLLAGLLLAPPTALDARAQSEGLEVEDRLDLVQVNRNLVAVIGDGRLPEIELEAGETVLHKKSGGLVGVASTNNRLLGVTSRSGWRQLRYRVNERAAQPTRIYLGDRVALVALPMRLVALAPGSSSWNQINLTPREEIRSTIIDSNVAGVITYRRAIAFSRESGFVTINMLPQESVESSSVEESSWILRTSERVLIFRRGAKFWITRRRIYE